MRSLDASTKEKPVGFMVNCAYPTFLCAEKQPSVLFDRLVGYQANALPLNYNQLDAADELKVEAISEWGDEMLKLNKAYGTKILGGCCGTGPEHLCYIVDNRN